MSVVHLLADTVARRTACGRVYGSSPGETTDFRASTTCPKCLVAFDAAASRVGVDDEVALERELLRESGVTP